MFKDDLIMIRLATKHPLSTLEPTDDLFVAILESIIGQQLSGKAAKTIFARFQKLIPAMSPKKILSTPDQKIRDCGLSWAKVSYVKNLALATQDWLDLEKIKTKTDEDVINELTKIKGIGRWTAEMILIFDLVRPDIFSVGDLGLRTAVAKHYKVDRNNLKKIAKISERWKPYRSLASRLLWKSLDNE